VVEAAHRPVEVHVEGLEDFEGLVGGEDEGG
jgi:hypothetical protein